MSLRIVKIIGVIILGLLILIPTLLYMQSIDFKRSYSQEVSELPVYTHGVEDGIYRIVANDMEFVVRVAGMSQVGPAIILLHGFPETSIMWQPLMDEATSLGYRVIAFDQRGYSPGARPHRVSDYHIDQLVGDVLAIADVMEMDSFNLVGHDWGAIVGWKTTMSHPERINTWTALSILHPAIFIDGVLNHPDQAKRSSYMDKLKIPILPEIIFLITKNKIYDGLADRWSNDQITHYKRLFSERGALSAALNWYRAFDLEVAFEDKSLDLPITCPTLYIWGAKDPVISHDLVPLQAGKMDASYSELRLEAGHSLMQEQEDAVVEAILEHIGRTVNTPQLD